MPNTGRKPNSVFPPAAGTCPFGGSFRYNAPGMSKVTNNGSVRIPVWVREEFGQMRGFDARIRSTTIIAVKAESGVAVGGDGQVTLGASVIKQGANKIRVLAKGKVVAGFAGAIADAVTLFERFEAMMEKHPGSLKRAAVELTKEWRTDKYLRRLEALLIAAAADELLIISGSGDVVEPDDGIAAIGSGADSARAAARALVTAGWTDARKIVETALGIAADICIYTNHNITVEELRRSG